MQEAAIAMAAFFFVLRGGTWRYGQALAMSDPLYLRATTACFSAIVVRQIVNVFLSASTRRSIFSTGILGNPLIWGGVIVEITLVALMSYTQLGNFSFGTAPIGPGAWLFILPFAAVMLAAEEVRKWIMRICWPEM
jgi:sodium/potassium-transporting ATPase subunit alpha